MNTMNPSSESLMQAIHFAYTNGGFPTEELLLKYAREIESTRTPATQTNGDAVAALVVKWSEDAEQMASERMWNLTHKHIRELKVAIGEHKLVFKSRERLTQMIRKGEI